MFDSLKKKLKNLISSGYQNKETSTVKEPIEEIPEKTVIKSEEVLETDKDSEVKYKEPSEINKTSETELKNEKSSNNESVEEQPINKGVFSIFSKITKKDLSENDIDKFLEGIKTALLQNDVAFETCEKICEEFKKSLIGKTVSRNNIEKTLSDSLYNSIRSILQNEKVDLEALIEKKYNETGEPFLIIIIGFNGVGKTTTLAKLANKLIDMKPVIAAGDTFRAGSIEQIESHAAKVGFDVIKHKYGSDSAAVIFDAKNHAKSKKSKVVIADTAGRSHSNSNLMDELKKIIRVNKPDMKILVLDSLAGNDIYEQSKLFNDAVDVDGVILTKADVYSKGGSCLSVSHTLKKPILYLGDGEKYENLQEFDPDKILGSLINY